MKIGKTSIPRMRVPAFTKGKMILFDLQDLRGHWSIISQFSPLDFGESIILNQLHRTIQNKGVSFVGMLPFAGQGFDSRLPKAKILRLPMLTDPIQRLQRTFGFTDQALSNRCQSYVVNPEGVIQYHLIHRLDWRGFSFLLEILQHCQEEYSNSRRSNENIHLGTNTSQESQFHNCPSHTRPFRTDFRDQKGNMDFATDFPTNMLP